MTEPNFESPRSYGCSNGDGNPYDVILVNVSDGTTDFLCMPCFVHVAAGVVEAMTNPESPDVQRALTTVAGLGLTPVPGPSGATGKRNAPAQNNDPGVFELYDAAVEWDGNPESIGG